MDDEDSRETKKQGFGPVFSRIYSFFSSRSGRSVKTFQWIVEDIASYNPERILDIGCGPGVLINMLSDRLPEAHIYGSDPSESMVSIARKRLSDKISQNKVSITKGDSHNIRFKEKFDIIVTTKSFHHWDDKQGSLDYLKNLLSENGSIIIYEGLGKHGSNDGGKMHHSLSVEEAEKIEVDGLKRTVKVENDVIAVKLSLDNSGSKT